MPDQKIIRIVGVLFILQLLTAIISYSVILEPVLHKPDFVYYLSNNSTMVIITMFLDLSVGLMVFGIAILLYPILKKYNERIALWYVGLRLNELICFVLAGVILLTLLNISRKYSPEEASLLDALAYYLRNARGRVQDISLIIYCCGTFMLYYLFYSHKLIPRFLSVWGMIAVLLLFTEITANIFNTSAGGMLIMMPMGLQELFLGGWLIVRGMNIKR